MGWLNGFGNEGGGTFGRSDGFLVREGTRGRGWILFFVGGLRRNMLDLI